MQSKPQVHYYKTVSPTQLKGLEDAIMEKVFGYEQVPNMVTLSANAQGHYQFRAQFMYEDTIPFPQKRDTVSKEREKQQVKDIAMDFFRKANQKVKENKQPKMENQDSIRPMFRDRDVDRGAFPSDFPDLFPIQYLEWQSTEPIFHPEYPKNIHYYEVRFRVELPVIAKQRFDSAQRPAIEKPALTLSSAKISEKSAENLRENTKATVQNEYIVLHINPDDKRYEIMGVESRFVHIAAQESTDLLEIAGENTGLYFLQEGNLKVPYWVAIKKIPATKIGTTNDAAQPINLTEEYCPMGIRVKFDMLHMIRELMEDGKEITSAKDYYKIYKEGKVLTKDMAGNPLTRGEKILIKYEVYKRIKMKYLNKFIERLRAVSGIKHKIKDNEEIDVIDLLPSNIGYGEANPKYLTPYENDDDPTIIVFTISLPISIKKRFFEHNAEENVLNTIQYMFHRAFDEGVVLWHKGFNKFKLEGVKGFEGEQDIIEGDKLINNSMFEMYGQPDHFINLTHLLAQDHEGEYLVSNMQFSYVMSHVFIEHLTGRLKKLPYTKAHDNISWHDIYFYLSKIPENGDKKKQIWNEIKYEMDRYNKDPSMVVRESISYGGNTLLAIQSTSKDSGGGPPCFFVQVIRESNETIDKTIPNKWSITKISILKTPTDEKYRHIYEIN